MLLSGWICYEPWGIRTPDPLLKRRLHGADATVPHYLRP
jgi:hypothetical protein